jgi:hypothetical protein
MQKDWSMAQVVKHLPSKGEDLVLPPKKKERKEEK